MSGNRASYLVRTKREENDDIWRGTKLGIRIKDASLIKFIRLALHPRWESGRLHSTNYRAPLRPDRKETGVFPSQRR